MAYEGRVIVARGLTPNHRGSIVKVGSQEITFVAVEHYDHISVVTGWDVFGESNLLTLDVDHMEKVTVYDR